MNATLIVAFVASVLASSGAAVQEPPAIDLPPEAEGSMQALLDSPRHGEWVDVPLTDAPQTEAGKAAPVRSWVVYPERRDRAPVVIVIHEIFGMSDWVRAVADRLAAEGFIAIAPDLLSGKGPGGGGTESFEGDSVRAAIRALTPDELATRLDAVRDHATKLPAARNDSACIGFCWGGSTSFLYATRQPGLKAAVVYYGTAPGEKEALARIGCPVLGLYGGDDARVTATVEGTKAAMSEAGRRYDARIYDGAGHGFLRRQTGREGANLRAAREAWRETIAFLRARLEPAKTDDE